MEMKQGTLVLKAWGWAYILDTYRNGKKNGKSDRATGLVVRSASGHRKL